MVQCEYCHYSGYRIIYQYKTWKIVKCRRCGCRYTLPKISKDFDLNNIYNSDYYNQSFFLEEVDYLPAAVEIEKYCSKKGRLLEIGCWKGDLLVFMRQRGWDVQGVEVSEFAHQYAVNQNKVPVFLGHLEDYPADKKFDVICLYQAFEHLYNPVYILQRCYELLNKGGILLIEVPNYNAVDIRFSRALKDITFTVEGGHLFFYTPAFLKKQLKKNGFKVLEVDRYYLNAIVNYYNKRKSGKNNKSEPTIVNGGEIENATNSFQLKRQISWKGKLMKKISRFLPGWKFTIIARKT